MVLHTDALVGQAVEGVKRASSDAGYQTVNTGLSAYPQARLDFDPLGAQAPEFAPLLVFCLDGTLIRGMALYLAKVHSPFLRARKKGVPSDLYTGDEEVALLELANQFLVTEAMLWSEARAGGFDGVPPYPLRYHAAVSLWSPKIAGAAFCLRCGTTLRYKNKGRLTGTRARVVPVCIPCHRSKSLHWPSHAVMPNGAGTWWLRCRKGSCTRIFSGSANRDFCDAHRR
jgi:hypothetical protein